MRNSRNFWRKYRWLWKCAEKPFLTENLIHYFRRSRIIDATERKDTIWQKCWYVSQSDFFVAGQRSAGVLTGARTTWNGCGNIWN